MLLYFDMFPVKSFALIIKCFRFIENYLNLIQSFCFFMGEVEFSLKFRWSTTFVLFSTTQFIEDQISHLIEKEVPVIVLIKLT